MDDATDLSTEALHASWLQHLDARSQVLEDRLKAMSAGFLVVCFILGMTLAAAHIAATRTGMLLKKETDK